MFRNGSRRTVGFCRLARTTGLFIVPHPADRVGFEGDAVGGAAGGRVNRLSAPQADHKEEGHVGLAKAATSDARELTVSTHPRFYVPTLQRNSPGPNPEMGKLSPEICLAQTPKWVGCPPKYHTLTQCRLPLAHIPE